jgi:hypothetical protein
VQSLKKVRNILNCILIFNLSLISEEQKTNNMKTITVNIAKQTVTINNETCNFYEAGLIPSGIIIVDADEIEEALKEREGEDSEIEFVGGVLRNPDAFQALVSINDNTKIRVYNDDAALEFVIMLEGDGRNEDCNFAVVDYVSKKEGLAPASINEYIDEHHQLQEDEDGSEYVEWVNGDFGTPYTVDDVQKNIRNYAN